MVAKKKMLGMDASREAARQARAAGHTRAHPPAGLGTPFNGPAGTRGVAPVRPDGWDVRPIGAPTPPPKSPRRARKR